ncbi:DUF1016 family protein [Candidatus Dependentiae bacterium]|nr:DUF1016 family protein [Candidatus Dependentiae bacterium]
MKNKKKQSKKTDIQKDAYNSILKEMVKLINDARRFTAKSVNAIMTATYWEIGRRIVENEQKGKKRAEYGEDLIKRLSNSLTEKFGRGFSRQNLQRFRQFYIKWSAEKICSTPSGKLQKGKYATVSRKSIPQKCSTLSSKSGKPEKQQTPSAKLSIQELSLFFLLPWSAYVTLLAVSNNNACEFYETEALRCGWSVRQLKRQIDSAFYERAALSKNKAEMLKKGAAAKKTDIITPEEEIKDPYILEFLDLKDEYSESELETALIIHLEKFLMELGSDFAFIGRQKRLRIGDEWYKIDLLFFHRRLRCLVVIDLKIGKFTHADAGQMHTYLNYAKEHWTNADENPPVGLILCAQKDEALAKYALKGLPNKVMAAEYKTILPDEKIIIKELKRTQKMLKKRNKNE